MAKQKRTIVGSPLTPTLLKELGAIDKLQSTPVDFNPDGNWVNTYRIWTCHGYRESGNQNVGCLQIQKKTQRSSETFNLYVEQTVLETDAMLSTTSAKITCLNNEYASPVRWQISNRFFGPQGKSLDELSTAENASIEGQTMKIKTPTGTLRRQVGTPLTSDWSLFEAAQRWDVGEAGHLLVTMLEALRILKRGQHITYRGLSKIELEPRATHLYCFAQLGSGILPYEYWLDDRHRLLAVISMNKAYILDDKAEQIIKREVKEARESYKRKRKQEQ